jgi:ABC-type antimicrobial peptide transport system permease subunit
MPQVPDSLDPGRMDVPPLFGWGNILVVVVVVIAISAVFLVIAAAVAARDDRSEWQEWLDTRSRQHEGP